MLENLNGALETGAEGSFLARFASWCPPERASASTRATKRSFQGKTLKYRLLRRELRAANFGLKSGAEPPRRGKSGKNQAQNRPQATRKASRAGKNELKFIFSYRLIV